MRRTAIALIVLLLAAAQPAGAVGKGDLHYGLKAGPSFSTTYAEGGRTEFLFSFAGGAFLCYNITDMFQVQPEVLYVGRGWKESAGDLELTNKLGYVDFDLLLKLAIPSQGSVSSSIGLGPYFGYRISDSYEWNMSMPPEVDEAMDLVFENLKDFDIGIVISGETDIALDNGGMVLFDLRIAYGLQSIFDEIEIDGVPVASIDLKNMGFQILVGYAF